MEFSIDIGYLGLVMLAIGALVIGIVFFVIGDPNFDLEWLATAIAAFIGGFVASEFVIAFQTWEPVYDGLALIPALVGGLVVGGLVAGVARFLTREPISAHETS